MTFVNYQLEIYLQGLSGILPTLPMDYAGWEAKAEVAMPPSIWSYVAGGAGDENAQKKINACLDKLCLFKIFSDNQIPCQTYKRWSWACHGRA